MKSKLEDISARAVVIGCGCSRTYSPCTHEIHPEPKEFYTIDISAEAEPDLLMDITSGEIPLELRGKFELSILEYVPFAVYNYNPFIVRATGTDGNRGFDNIKELTADNGFIMVIGNPRLYNFRSTIGKLNYLEVAAQTSLPEPGYVLLIPKNQKLSFAEALEELERLPKPLKESIQKARTIRDYTPLDSTGFSTLNYQPSPQNARLIEELQIYTSRRNFEQMYRSVIAFLGSKFTFGFSLIEKKSAAEALIQVLLGNTSPESLKEHSKALTQGRLGALVTQHLGDLERNPTLRLLMPTKSYRQTVSALKNAEAAPPGREEESRLPQP